MASSSQVRLIFLFHPFMKIAIRPEFLSITIFVCLNHDNIQHVHRFIGYFSRHVENKSPFVSAFYLRVRYSLDAAIWGQICWIIHMVEQVAFHLGVKGLKLREALQ